MSNLYFEKACNHLINLEGGYSNDPLDAGGETKYGISKRMYPKLDIKNLTKREARDIYKIDYWDKYNLKYVGDYKVAEKVLAAVVNIGPLSGIKCLQRAARAASGKILKEDGILGIKTASVTNNCDDEMLLAAYRSELAGFYRSLNHPYEEGLLNRAYD